MNKFFTRSCIVLTAIVSISGCTKHKTSGLGGNNKTVSEQTSGKQASQSDTAQRLQKCLFEAEQLSKISGAKYASKKADLYHVIQSAKYYASISSDISSMTVESMTPYYQFKVNDICNDISWAMYNELKAGAMTPVTSK
ncbi:hypothetical protein [Klebsiella aerogenes]|uniref:hypothetical protein n=1 Tax=Klebsiella aerogenes TaxID=548 RepID=UPI001F1D7807|nr:hypothetical protein [Klebsiella aerogenes]